MMMSGQKLRDRIIGVLPKDSVGRYDLFPVFKDPVLFADCIRFLAAPYIGRVDYVAAPEAIGWILGSAMARELNVGFIPIRKVGRLPYPKDLLISQSYVDYSNKPKALEINKNYVSAGDRILIVDEWVETGRTIQCCIRLLEQLGCAVVGLATIGIDCHEGTKHWLDGGFVTCIGQNM